MQHFYDGAIRRYVTQTIRILSEFTVRYGDGSLHRIPVLYGDADRQAASILRQNSENAVNSVPRISVYIYGLDLDRDRLADSTFVSKLHVRERDIVNGSYTGNRGRNYTIERLMPTPFKLTMKVDIWSANTDQKLQILEQILMLFNPSLEIQTTDNYADWTSLSVLNLDSVNWSSRTVPVGADTPIDIATLTLSSPIWISPPVKVKQLGVITKVITGLFEGNSTYSTPLFGADYLDPNTKFAEARTAFLAEIITVVEQYSIEVYENQITLLSASYSTEHDTSQYGRSEVDRSVTPWEEILSKYPEKFIPRFSRLFIKQRNGTEINGTISLNSQDESIMDINWDIDTLNRNTGIDSSGNLDTDTGYHLTNRANSPGTFDAIINPLEFNPRRPLKESTDQPIAIGLRYLLIESIGSDTNSEGAIAWRSIDDIDLIAHENDIIEWTGTRWNVIFDSVYEADTMIWQTNTYTGIQFVWNGVAWTKSFEGLYKAGTWRLEL